MFAGYVDSIVEPDVLMLRSLMQSVAVHDLMIEAAASA